MFGNATLEIPASGDIGPTQMDGLSDQLAMIMGRTAARTLSERDDSVSVTLESGTVVIIGHEQVDGTLIIGCSMEVITRCGGFREYANDVIMGPLL